MPLAFWIVSLTWVYSFDFFNPFVFNADELKDQFFYWGIAVIGLVNLARRNHSQLENDQVSFHLPVLFLLLYLGFTATSVIHPVNYGRGDALTAFSHIFLWVVLGILIARTEAKTLWTLAFVSLVNAALIAVKVWCCANPAKKSIFFPPIGHISYLSDFVAMHLPIGIFLFFNCQKRWIKILALVFCFPLLSVFWLSGTRAAFMGVLVSLLLFGGVASAIRRKNLIYMAMGLVMVVLLVGGLTYFKVEGFRTQGLLERFQPLLGGPKILHDMSAERMHGLGPVWKMVKAHPWKGSGIGSFRFIYPGYDGGVAPLAVNHYWYLHPHNEVLHQAVETGAVGLVLFLAFFGSLYGGAFKFILKAENQNRMEVLMLLCGMTVLLVSWQFDTVFLHPLGRLGMAFYAACLYVRLKPVFKTKFSIRAPRKLAAGFLIGVIMILSLRFLCLISLSQSYHASSPEMKLQWAKKSYLLSLKTFGPLMTHANNLSALHGPETLTYLDELYEIYPFVSDVVYLKAQFFLEQGNYTEAKFYCEKVNARDPTYSAAKQCLQVIESLSK